jgi:hypothetical protein
MHDRRFLPLSLLLAAVLLLLPVASHPQSMNGSVSGTVLDPTGSPVPGVSMTLKHGARAAADVRDHWRLRLP